MSKLNVPAAQTSQLGLTFAIDINEDRQVQLLRAELGEDGQGERILEDSIMRMEGNKKALIYIGSLGDLIFLLLDNE